MSTTQVKKKKQLGLNPSKEAIWSASEARLGQWLSAELKDNPYLKKVMAEKFKASNLLHQ